MNLMWHLGPSKTLTSYYVSLGNEPKQTSLSGVIFGSSLINLSLTAIMPIKLLDMVEALGPLCELARS